MKRWHKVSIAYAITVYILLAVIAHTNSCSFKKGMEAEKKILNDLNLIKK